MKWSLDIHGIRCEVLSHSPRLDERLAHVIRHLGLPEEPGGSERLASLRFQAAEGVVPNTPDGPPTASYEGGYLRVWDLGDGAALSTEHTGTEVRLEEGRASCIVSTDQDGECSWVQELAVSITSSLFLLLRPHGFLPLHAAALAHGEHGLLLVAESDAGKSTTAFTLVRQGWAFLSDDSVLLRTGADGIGAFGFRRTFGLDVGAEARFPELAAVEARQPSDPDKYAVPVDAMYPEQSVAACRPSVLIFPSIESRAESILEPLTKVEAVVGLAAQSALITFRADWAPAHFEALRDLAHQASAYRLRAGRDLLSDPSRLVELLATVWPESLLPSAATLGVYAHE